MYKDVKIRVSLDSEKFDQKPDKGKTLAINSRLARSIEVIAISELARQLVAPNSRTFCPSVFNGESRKNDSWVSQQVFALDLDENITIQQALDRCKEYKVMPTFIYTSFSHKEEHHKFRMVFILNEEVTDIRVRAFVYHSLATIFPEVDKQTKDAARMFYGGKNIVFEDYNNIITVPQVHFALTKYIKSTKGRNASREFEKFAALTGVQLHNGLPNLETFNSELDLAGRQITDLMHVNLKKNRTNPIYTIGNAQNFFSIDTNYMITFTAEKQKYYSSNAKFSIDKQKSSRDLVRDFDFQELEDTCQLFRDAKSGDHWLYHGEMFGLMTNLLCIKGGSSEIEKVLKARTEYASKNDSWNVMVKQIQKMSYAPTECNTFCPFADTCHHGKNMIEQGKMFRNGVQKVENKELKTLEEAKEELITQLSQYEMGKQALM